jgi:hypothetical protein
MVKAFVRGFTVYSDHDFGWTELQTIGTDSGLVESCVYGKIPECRWAFWRC